MMHQFRMRMLMESVFILGRFFYIQHYCRSVNFSSEIFTSYKFNQKIFGNQIMFGKYIALELAAAMLFFLSELRLRCDCLEINIIQNLLSSEKTKNKTLCNGMFDGFFSFYSSLWPTQDAFAVWNVYGKNYINNKNTLNQKEPTKKPIKFHLKAMIKQIFMMVLKMLRYSLSIYISFSWDVCTRCVYSVHSKLMLIFDTQTHTHSHKRNQTKKVKKNKTSEWTEENEWNTEKYLRVNGHFFLDYVFPVRFCHNLCFLLCFSFGVCCSIGWARNTCCVFGEFFAATYSHLSNRQSDLQCLFALLLAVCLFFVVVSMSFFILWVFTAGSVRVECRILC